MLLWTSKRGISTSKSLADTFREVMADFPMNAMHEEVYDMAIEVMEGRTKKWTHAEGNKRYAEKIRQKRSNK